MEKIKIKFRDKGLFIRLFGGDIYAVGGYVRDLVTGSPPEEMDLLVTRHSLQDIIRKINPHGKVDIVGKSFGIIKFSVRGRTYDIALPRKDVPKETPARRHQDFLISADPGLPIEKDLERRDFRCNSMALRLKDGKIIDPFNGSGDAREKLIRLTNPRAFPEDPLRVLRAARMASVLEYSVDPEIYEIAKEVDLSGLSVERTNEEMFKILLRSPRPSVGLEELFKLNALKKLYPELYKLTLSVQDSLFHPEKDVYGHHSVWHHTKLTVDQAKVLAETAGLNQARKLCLLVAALYHDAGKPVTAEWEFKKGRMVITNNSHDLASERIAKKALARLRIYSWSGLNLRRMVPLLIRSHHRLSELWLNREAVTKKAFNRLAADISGEIDLLIYLDAADRAGRKDRLVRSLDRQGRWLLRKFEALNVSKETIAPLILGRDLIAIGVPPGPGMGRILKRLYELQLDNVFETKKQGLRETARLIAGKKR